MAKTFTVKVDQAFIDQRDERVISYNSTPEKVDCEFLEYYLNQPHSFSQFKKEDSEWWYDSYHPDYGYVDFKCKSKHGPWYSVTTKSLNTNVDTYIGWRWVKKPNLVLQEGDIVTMEIVAYHSKEYVKQNIRFKNYPDSGFIMMEY